MIALALMMVMMVITVIIVMTAAAVHVPSLTDAAGDRHDH
jgi:hypothetical protein